VGQDSVVRTLASALDSGKIAHAYLFSGPRGSGKTSAAKIMARCLNCIHGPSSTPDNTCEYCRAILDGTALDVLEIDAASNRGIDEIRALRDAVKFAPSAMRYKVYIIDEAHMLTKEGANAFLKTLEEPPPHVVFILATTEPEKLPVTILSRCQRYAFRRIAIPVMIERMRAIAREEKISVDDAALAAIAYRADGGLRDALTMLEQAAAFAGMIDGASGKIDLAMLDTAFGATGRNYAHSLIDAVLARDASATLRVIEEASDAGADMQVLIRALIAEFRNLLVARVDPELLSRDLAPDDALATARRAKDVPQATIVRALRLLADAAALARSSGNARLELESALLRFVLASEDPTLDAIAARLAAIESGNTVTASAPVVSATARLPVEEQTDRAEPPTPTAEPALETVSAEQPRGHATDAVPSLQKVRAAWQKIRGRAEGERPSLRAPLSTAMVEAVEGHAIVLRLRDKVSGDILREHAKLLEAAVADVLGTPLHITCKVDASKAGLTSASKSSPTAGEDPDELFQYANERIRQP
jgi:DNA polymerase-3 subunit gamma/tau